MYIHCLSRTCDLVLVDANVLRVLPLAAPKAELVGEGDPGGAVGLAAPAERGLVHVEHQFADAYGSKLNFCIIKLCLILRVSVISLNSSLECERSPVESSPLIATSST